jgi:hypothetical protein
VNRLNAWVDRLPGPSWTYYAGLWLALSLVLVLALWIEGVYPVGSIFPVQVFIPGMIALFLGMIHNLDRRADMALTRLQPAIRASETESEQLRYRLVTLPAWSSLLVSLAVTGFFFLLGLVTGEAEDSIVALSDSLVAAIIISVTYYAGWWCFSTFLYHTYHQLSVVSRILTSHTRVDLFRLRPHYGFSTVSALTAVTLVIATYGWTALNPDNLSDLFAVVVILLITVLALVTYVWPLLGIHRVLDEEKARLLGDCRQRLASSFDELHRRVDTGEIEGMTEFNMAMASLEMEHSALKEIPTWPWQPETFSMLITALALPLGLWILQYVLQLFLGG